MNIVLLPVATIGQLVVLERKIYRRYPPLPKYVVGRRADRHGHRALLEDFRTREKAIRWAKKNKER